MLRREYRSSLDVCVPLVLMALTWASRHGGYYRVLVGENGIFEWLQVLALGVATVALFDAAKRTEKPRRWALIVAGAAGVFAIGEELAWGTGFIGREIGVIAGHNLQGDTTLHNLGGGLELSFGAIATVATVLGVLIAIRSRLLPATPNTLISWLLVPGVFALFRLGASHVTYETAKLSEAAELAFAIAIARLAILEQEQAAKSSVSSSTLAAG